MPNKLQKMIENTPVEVLEEIIKILKCHLILKKIFDKNHKKKGGKDAYCTNQ